MKPRKWTALTANHCFGHKLDLFMFISETEGNRILLYFPTTMCIKDVLSENGRQNKMVSINK